MDALVFFIISICIAIAIGRYWQYKSTEKKIKEREYNLELKNKARELNIEDEYNKKNEEIDILLSEARVESKNILNKAVDYAFNFKKEFSSQHKTAEKEIQKVLDDGFRFKRNVLLKSVTLKNQAVRFEEIKKEREIYQGLIAKYDFFSLSDNSSWDEVENEFRNKLLMLQAAQDEREAQDEIKRKIREEKQRADELERQQREAEERERILKEKRVAIEQALLEATEEHKKELEEQRIALEKEIEDVHNKYERAKSMAQMTRQGNVYIISNVGSFGENIFKVGMTRRLEPMDRISELNNASVPFEFDVHAMISCDDAPTLEKKIHEELSDFRMNKVNTRKEFFKVDISKIIKIVEGNHGVIDYISNPIALQYHKTLELEKETCEV